MIKKVFYISIAGIVVFFFKQYSFATIHKHIDCTSHDFLKIQQHENVIFYNVDKSVKNKSMRTMKEYLDKIFTVNKFLDTMAIADNSNDQKLINELSILYSRDINGCEIVDFYNCFPGVKMRSFKAYLFSDYTIMPLDEVVPFIKSSDNYLFFFRNKMVPIFTSMCGDYLCYCLKDKRIYYMGSLTLSGKKLYIPIFKSIDSLFNCGIKAINDNVFYSTEKGMDVNYGKWDIICQNMDGSEFWMN